MKMYPDMKKAENLLLEAIEKRNSSNYPFSDENQKSFFNHSKGVAKIASTIAGNCQNIDSEKAYVLGLLHDCGRIVDEYSEKKFHGLVGYCWMKELGYVDVAKICLTHSFSTKNFDVNIQPNKFLIEDYKISKNIINKLSYDDYDKLIQLSDMMNNLGINCTIEDRWKDLKERYNIHPDYYQKNLKIQRKIKEYFENLAHCDIYKLLHITDI